MYKKLKWLIKNFAWIKVYFSPFKPPTPRFYFGKVALGVPYFLPRIWKKATPEKAKEETLEEIERIKKYNEGESTYKRTVKTFDELYSRYINSSFSQPKKIGFDFVPLGWKTKWTSTDYRFEWSPMWSFVCFGYQFAVTFVAIEAHHFWECYLFYSRETKGTTEERIKQARKKFPCVWSSTKNGVTAETCYWDVILKDKYR
jgi:hypothetical protein